MELICLVWLMAFYVTISWYKIQDVNRSKVTFVYTPAGYP